MSWLERAHRPVAGPKGKWMCDHCAEVYPGSHPPKHRRVEGGPHRVLAARVLEVRLSNDRWWRSVVHYCSDECAEQYIGQEVEAALIASDPDEGYVERYVRADALLATRLRRVP